MAISEAVRTSESKPNRPEWIHARTGTRNECVIYKVSIYTTISHTGFRRRPAAAAFTAR